MSRKRSSTYRPPELNRDHARPRTAPAPTSAAVEARLTELISPATYALADQYRRLGLRWRVLPLPVMAALVLSLIWRQVPSVSTLAALLAREPLLWEPPRRVSQQALSKRLRELPAALFGRVFHAALPALLARAAARTRPQPPPVRRALGPFERVWVVDATTLEAVFRKVGALREAPAAALGGKLLAVLDLPSKLPVHLWYDEDPAANEKSFLDRLRAALPAGTLLVLDRGFYAFPLFDWLTEHGGFFLTRARALTAFTGQQDLLETPTVRDRIIRLGRYRSNPCAHPVRLIEVRAGTGWRGYLTNVLDPARLSAADAAELYARRWRVEEAFLLVKRLLGLAYLWTGAVNGIVMQVWATWLLYAVLVDLSDAVAEELNVPLDRISLEMVYRGLYFFCGAYQRGDAADPVAYLAAQTDLGIVKRRRKYRERAQLDKPPQELKL
jgi:Transposase DDE domain